MRMIEEKEGLEAKKLGGWNAGSDRGGERGGWGMEEEKGAAKDSLFVHRKAKARH